MIKRGIVVVNTGSPSAPTPDAVSVYLREFLSDPRICPMNPIVWNFILNRFILPKRSFSSARKYQLIWTPDGPPLELIMRLLTVRLQDRFDMEDEANPEGDATRRIFVRYAMSYGEPFVKDVFDELREVGVEEIVVMPLYPQGALSTVAVVKDKVEQSLDALGWEPECHLIESYSEREDYVDAVAHTIEHAGFDPGKDKLLLDFHSIPIRDIKAGDIYPELVFSSGAAIASRVGAKSCAWEIGFQCRFDKSRKWLGPYVGESLRKLIDSGMNEGGRLFVVAPNFSIDCLETLYDIEIEFRHEFRKLVSSGRAGQLEDMVYVPCLNDSDAHVELIYQIIAEVL